MLAVMISFLVLGIEGISSYIEEPFHVSVVVDLSETQRLREFVWFVLLVSTADLCLAATRVKG